MVGLQQAGVFVLQTGVVGALLLALRRGNIAAAVNAAIAFAVTLVPVFVGLLIEADGSGGATATSELALWIAAAGLLHSVGMLGLYETTWWWDHLTHGLSAALVAALVYAGVIVTTGHAPTVSLGRGGAAAVTVGYTLAVGLVWELLELVAREVGERYGVEPVLVHYGWRDTAYDLGFDLLGALVVVLLDLRLFVPLLERIPVLTRQLLLGIGAVAITGSLLFVVAVGRVMVAPQRDA